MPDFSKIIEQMIDAGVGGLLERDLIINGQLQRYRPDGSKNKTAWYVLHEFTTKNNKTIIVGAFGDWREGLTHKIQPDKTALTDDERDQFKKQIESNKREAEKKRKSLARRAALRAKDAWSSPKLSTSGSSDYLTRKKAKGFGVKFSPSGALVIPMHDIGGDLHGLQLIYKSGNERVTKGGDVLEKDFWPYGASPAGHFHKIGFETQKDASRRVRLVVCEGYATGDSIHQATGLTVYVAFNAGNLLLVAQAVRKVDPDVEIIIAADDDYLTYKPVNNPGKAKANQAAAKVKGRVVLPVFKNRDGEKWTDFNDLHVTEGLDAVAACFNKKNNDWVYKLRKNNDGKLLPTTNNVSLILENDERWAGVLQYDRFTYDVVKTRPPPFVHNSRVGEWQETDTTRLNGWLAQAYDFEPREDMTIKAVKEVSEMLGRHPVQEYLHGLKWDGTKRLSHWMADLLGAEQNEYTAAVGTKWMIGAVARVHAEPGRLVKMDNVLILEGGQGAGKSTVVALLAKPWSAESHFDIGSKDGYQQLRGVWIYELAELDAFNKAESTKAKAFFTTSEDNYRPSYGHRTQKFPRQVVFVGTTNQDQYLKDVTGNRRYWPIRCGEINLQALEKIRDQLWAEALHLYRAGTPWWVLPTESDVFHYEQENRFQDDAWESVIVDYLNTPEQRTTEHYSTAEILRDALGFQVHQMKPPEMTRVGLLMKRIGWTKTRFRKNGKLVWAYMRPENERVSVKSGSDDVI